MKTTIGRTMIMIAALLLLVGAGTLAQAQRETIQAASMGQGTQLGRVTNITIIIEQYSTPEDQQILLQAFQAKGSQGLYNALYKMSSKGHVAITGTLGYDVTYIREFKTPTGRKIRLVTNRPVTMGELWTDSRSTDYNLTALELNLDANGKGEGTLLPACQFTLNKENEIEIEALQNPWKLTDVVNWGSK